MNYYNREKDEWCDKKLQEIFLQFSLKNKKFPNPLNYYIQTNIETIIDVEDWGGYTIELNDRTPLKIILSISSKGIFGEDFYFTVSGFDEIGEIYFKINKKIPINNMMEQ